MAQTPRHRVFISNHHADQSYKDWFVHAMGDDIIDESVGDGDIDDTNIAVDTIRRKIRDEFIRDATVTVVLIGPCTWQRKHVDWEIGSSLRHTLRNPRCGLLGILLPNHCDYGKDTFREQLIPPRLADNCGKRNSFARIYALPDPLRVDVIRAWIHTAFERRHQNPPPINNRRQFGRNRGGRCAYGWQN